MMTITSAVRILLSLALAMPITASMGDVKAPAKVTSRPGTTISVVGTLVDGVECPALRADKTNELFTLTGKPGNFKNGDHVKVTGKVVELSICQQGTTIAVAKIVRVKSHVRRGSGSAG
jgi:hypothetical protein